MRNLQELQIQFQHYLQHQHPAIKNHIISTDQACALTRLEIYRNAYYLRLIEAIEQDYPVLQMLIGHEEFHQLVQQYIDLYPSRFRSIRWVGKELVTLLKNNKPYTQSPWLGELAEFEWLLTDAFDAADKSPVTIEEMASVPFEQWPELRFILHPTLRRLTLAWNVVDIWKACKEEIELPLPEQNDLVTWIVWRKELDVQFGELTVDEAYFLEAMLNHQTFGALCEGLCEWIDEQHVATHAALLLKRFMVDGLIVEIVMA